MELRLRAWPVVYLRKKKNATVTLISVSIQCNATLKRKCPYFMKATCIHQITVDSANTLITHA